MTESNEFGKKVVEVITFPVDDTIYDEEFKKLTLCINHPVGKLFPNSVINMLNIREVRDLYTTDVWGPSRITSYPINM